MGTPAQALNYPQFLIELLLRKLFWRRSETDYRDLKISLDDEISRLGPAVTGYIQTAVFGQFGATELGAGSADLVEWYLEVMSGKSREWLTPLSAARVLSAYVIPNEATRVRLVQFALLIEYLQEINVAVSALVARARMVAMLSEEEGLTSHGEIISQALIEEFLIDSPQRAEHTGRSVGNFAIQVLRQCFVEAYQPLPEWLLDLLMGRVGSIGDERKEQARFMLRQPR